MTTPPFIRETMIRTLVTLVFGCAGAALFVWLKLPAPILSGAMIGVIVALVAGLKPDLPDTLRDGAMFLSGCGYGSAITRDMLDSFSHYPLSLALLTVTVILIIFVSRLWLIRVAGWDVKTATYASIPGALSAVLAVAAEAKADMARVVVVQSFRSLVIVVLLPSVVTIAGAGAAATARPEAGLADLAIILAASFVGALAFKRLRIVAPFIFGAMLVSAGLHVSGAVQGGLPLWLTDIGFILLGGYFGTRFTGTTLATLKDSLWHATASFAITMGLAWIVALVIVEFTDVMLGEALVAFAPGGLEAMMAVAGSLGLNPLYVGAHHFGRLIGLNFLIPMIGPWLARNGDEG
ncbi:MAG: AbrB family transcriptional regulator [Beijerinckiaceae bacterium]|nr:AbrB family transcriptional regulator [Beijerinckiaceae bacterium]